MGKYRFFDHYTQASDWFAKGASAWDRMAASGYTYNTWKGENIAAGMSTAAQVFAGWRNSSGHNANMLKADFKVIGISLVSTSGSPYVHYWTTDFGGYVDPTAHDIGSTQPTPTTTTVRPTTTTLPAPTTTVRPASTTTTPAPTTTATTRPPTTTTTPAPPTTTTTRPVITTTTTDPPMTTTTIQSDSAQAFSDVTAATPYSDAINLLAAQSIVDGYPDGAFHPERVVSRQQIAKMLALTAGYQVSPLASCGFLDVGVQLDADDPLYPRAYIAACAAHGVIVGKTPSLFAPYDPVTRAQIITMVARAAQLPASSPTYVPPFADFCPDHYPWAVRAAEAGLLDGLRGMGHDYDFWRDATRGEVCEVLAQLLR